MKINNKVIFNNIVESTIQIIFTIIISKKEKGDNKDDT